MVYLTDSDLSYVYLQYKSKKSPWIFCFGLEKPETHCEQGVHESYLILLVALSHSQVIIK